MDELYNDMLNKGLVTSRKREYLKRVALLILFNSPNYCARDTIDWQDWAKGNNN